MMKGTLQYARAVARDAQYIEMLREHLDGATYHQIANKHGLSVSFVGGQMRRMFLLECASYRTPLPPDLLARVQEMKAK